VLDYALLKKHISAVNRAICVGRWQLIAWPSVYFDGDVPPSLHPFLPSRPGFAALVCFLAILENHGLYCFPCGGHP
jgi:hypothetical protein